MSTLESDTQDRFVSPLFIPVVCFLIFTCCVRSRVFENSQLCKSKNKITIIHSKKPVNIIRKHLFIYIYFQLSNGKITLVLLNTASFCGKKTIFIDKLFFMVKYASLLFVFTLSMSQWLQWDVERFFNATCMNTNITSTSVYSPVCWNVVYCVPVCIIIYRCLNSCVNNNIIRFIETRETRNTTEKCLERQKRLETITSIRYILNAKHSNKCIELKTTYFIL
jgi:hypothetical protein